MRLSPLADRVVPVRAKVSSVSPPPVPDRVRPQAPVDWMRPSPLADRVVPVRAQVGSVLLLPLLDCIDSLQTPVGSTAPIPTVWLADRQCYHWSSVVRQ